MDDRFDPLEDLRQKREALEARMQQYRAAAKKEVGELGFWSLVGGFAVAADWMILGGVGTGIAVLSGATLFNAKREEKKIEKQLAKIDERIDRLVVARLEQEKNNPALNKNLSEQFSPAAQKEIDLLRARLEDLEKQVDKNRQQDNGHDLDKPKFKPPKPPEAG